MTSQALERSISYIYDTLDLRMIEKKITSNHYLGYKWLKKDAALACKLYRNFLCLNVKYKETNILVPSEEIDEIWHNHILETKKYAEDCMHIFGSYFHHYPYLGFDDETTRKDLNKAFANSQKLYFQEFGEYY